MQLFWNSTASISFAKQMPLLMKLLSSLVHLGIHLIYIGNLHELFNSVFRCLNWTHEFTMHISTFHYKLPPHRKLALESPCHSAMTSSTLYSQQGLTDRSMLFLPIRNISPFGSPSYCLPLQLWEKWKQLLLYWCACSLPPIGSVYWDSRSQLKN